LVDINLLDGMTGPDIARRLVTDYGCAVIFLTANPEQIPDGFAGALGAVSKPFDETTIRAVVAFAGQLIRQGAAGDPPRRFNPAPWLTASTTGTAPR
jgi:CheY-like chemotaxis protein